MNGARVVEVILVETGEDQKYYTKEGVHIGSIVAGTVMVAEQSYASLPDRVPYKPKSGVIKGPTPEKVAVEQARENDEILASSAQDKAKHAAEKNLAKWQKGEK